MADTLLPSVLLPTQVSDCLDSSETSEMVSVTNPPPSGIMLHNINNIRDMHTVVDWSGLMFTPMFICIPHHSPRSRPSHCGSMDDGGSVSCSGPE